MDIGYAGAFAGGILTLLSPCSAMLLPAFFAYAFSTRRQLAARSLVFYAGLITTLVPLGVFAGAIGSLMTQNRDVLIISAASIVIIIGLLQVAGVSAPSFIKGVSAVGTSTVSVYVLGAVYGVAGVCTGPILGSILTIAAAGGNPAYGGILLALYALGMAVPLFVLAILWDRLGVARHRWLRPRPVTIGRWSNSLIMVISGVLSIGIGVLLLVSNGTSNLGGTLSVGDQFALESATTTAASGVSNGVFAVVALAILATAFLLYRRSNRTARQPVESASRD